MALQLKLNIQKISKFLYNFSFASPASLVLALSLSDEYREFFKNILGLFGIGVEDNFIILEKKAVAITPFCTGFTEFMFLSALIISLPNISLNQKLRYIILFYFLIFVFSILRFKLLVLLPHFANTILFWLPMLPVYIAFLIILGIKVR